MFNARPLNLEADLVVSFYPCVAAQFGLGPIHVHLFSKMNVINVQLTSKVDILMHYCFLLQLTIYYLYVLMYPTQ